MTVAAAAGEVVPDLDLEVRPRVTADAAQRRAVAATARRYATDSAHFSAVAPELWIADERIFGGRGLYKPALVWRIQVSSSVDAHLSGPIGRTTLIRNPVFAALAALVIWGGARTSVSNGAYWFTDLPGSTAVLSSLEVPMLVVLGILNGSRAARRVAYATNQRGNPPRRPRAPHTP